MICAFIAEHRARFGVASICATLTAQGCKIASRTYYAWARRAPSKRALWDLTITELLAGYYEPDEHGRRKPESLYGSLKMWAHLNRQGITVARCTVERLMRANGWRGVTRARKVRTTIADPTASRAPDLVDRQFRVPAPNRLLVADFTYVRLATGAFAYTAFVIDAYAGRIVGWECSTSKHTIFVEAAIRQAATLRAREGNPLQNKAIQSIQPIHHSDSGSQFRSRKFIRALHRHQLVGSMGQVGAAGDNAAMESFFALLQNNVLNRHRWSTRQDLRIAIVTWIERTYHRRRRQTALGRLTPIEYETIMTKPANQAA